ncbi:MAG: TonB-dependent receptor, partial [Salibacteraceae bacterium]
MLNIITKNPEHEPLVSADVMMTSHKEFFGNAAIATRTKNWQNYTGVNFTTMNEYEDANNDGFGDRIGMDRLSFFSKWSMERPDHKKLTIAAKLYVEDRRNGVESFVKNRAYRDLRGSESIYGESIYTLRSEVFGTYEFQSSANVRLDYSLSWHEQDSYYGSDHYQAEQGIAFTNLIWTKRKGKHTLLGGLTNRFQYYDDNTIATDEEVNNGADRQYIPGIFLEDEWSLFSSLNLLAGMRLDHYHNHGFIPSPRLSVKKDLGEWTTWRLNSGTGFKIVNLFTEDHAFVSGQRSVEIKEVIDPERSWNVSTNLNHTHALFGSSGAIDADVYYTHFTNKITPDYSDPTKIIYANSDGFAKSYGLSFSFSQQFSFPLSYNLGVNLNRTELAEENEQGEVSLRPIEFAPEWSGVVSVNYRLRKWKLDFSYSASINGPMALPEVYDLNENGLP